MDYQMLVKNLFNDMFVFFNGTQPLGLEPLIDVYQDEPLLMALIGRLDEAVKVPYNDVMKECYAFYKQYAGGDYTDEVWEQIVKDIQDFNQKWQNPWCRGIILALLELLEQEDKERQELQSQGTLAEDAAQEPGFTETEGQNGMEWNLCRRKAGKPSFRKRNMERTGSRGETLPPDDLRGWEDMISRPFSEMIFG